MPLPSLPVTVPGKLFLLGEYAVLAGAPALLTTVDRRVSVTPRHDRRGYEVRGASFQDPLELPLLVQQVLDDTLDRRVDLNHLTADLSEFYHQGAKLGLGSSAASTVALVSSVAPDLTPTERFTLSWKIHHLLQGKIGSGADIAASTFGGLIAYELHRDAQQPPFQDLQLPQRQHNLEMTPAHLADIGSLPSLPDSLRLDAIWTGTPASSVSFISGLQSAFNDHLPSIRSVFHDLHDASEAGLQALVDGDPQSLLDAFSAADQAMEDLGETASLPIITDAHRRIRALAHTTRSVAKPSGAGGGDFSLLLGPRDAPIPAPIEDQFLVLPVFP